MTLFQIENLCVEPLVKTAQTILHHVCLNVNPGEVHVIMGPNGAGKSTLAHVVAGHPAYRITDGHVRLHGEDIETLLPEERAYRGLFVGFQYPIEVPGVHNAQFLRAACNAKRKNLGHNPLSQEEFSILLSEKMTLLGVSGAFTARDVNTGLSGGEKKKNEILQMLLLDPQVAILDETDSGLDVDAMKIVANGISSFMTSKKALILITHYERLLQHIVPDVVHIMMNGRIVVSGGRDIAQKIEEQGYDWVRN